MPPPARRVSGATLRSRKRESPPKTVFDVQSFLESNGLGRQIAKFRSKQTIYSQGDPANDVIYIQEGGVRLTVVSATGKEAIVEILGPGDFFGLRSFGVGSVYTATATTMMPTTLLIIKKDEMIRVLHAEHDMSDHFIANIMIRNGRGEDALIDQLFNSSEKRLARTLLILARYGIKGQPQKSIPNVSQEALAEMIGSTRSRVNFFMNKFKKLGYIEYNYRGSIHVNKSLLSVVLND